MSEAVSLASITVPTTPQYQVLKDVYDRWIEAKNIADKAAADVNALNAELVTLAQSIKEQGIVDDNWELAPTFEAKSMEKVDSDRMKQMHPELFDKCDPHISKNDIATTLQKVHGEANLQKIIRESYPEMYREKATVTKAAVIKNCSKSEIQALKDDGCLYVQTTFGGEIKLLNKHEQAEIRRLHSPVPDDDEEDDE